MERSIVAVEENNQGSNSTTTVSKTLGSLVKIDSISIDLGIAMEKNEAGKCQHFSIRGYVAEMRKKDRRICSPFASDDNHSNLEEQLPPLYVAKFRWWRCGNCLQEIGAASTSAEIGGLSKCCKSGFISSSTCSHMPSDGDTAMGLSDLQQAPTLENCEGRKADANISANLNAEVGHKAIDGCENGLEGDANQENGNPTRDLTIFNPCLIKERHTPSTVPIESNGSGSIDICEPNHTANDAAVSVPVIEYPKYKGGSFGEICQKVSSSEEEQRTVLATCETSKVGCKIDEGIDSVRGQTVRLPSFEPEECDNASSESDEILPRQHHDNSSGLTRRKTRKVRLLTELLGGKGNAENDNRRAQVGYSNAVPNVSAGLASLSAHQGEVALHESGGNGFRGPHRKRKVPQDQNWNNLAKSARAFKGDAETSNLEMSCPNNLAKSARAFKGDAETSNVAIENSDSEPEEDSSAGVGLQTGVRSEWSKHVINRNPTPGQKKNKQTQVGDGYFPSMQWRDVMPKINHDKIGDPEKCGGAAADTGFSKSMHDPFRDREMEPYLKSYMSLEQTGKDSSSFKKKDKMPQVEDWQASFMLQNKNMFGEGSIKRKDLKILQAGSEMVKPQSGNDVCAKIGLDLSLNSYMAAERNDQSYIAQVADKIDSLLPQPKGIPSKNFRIKDGTFAGESSFSRNSVPDPFMRDRFLSDLNERIAHKTAISREQKNYSPQVEDGSYSLHQNLDLSGPCNSKKTIGVHGRSEMIRMHCDQRAEKVYEQGTSDDIPMEIVELMAKNQYERGLYKTQRNYCPSERTNNKSNAEMMSFPKVHGDGLMRPFQKEYPTMRKHSSTNYTYDVVPTGERVLPTKRNPFDFSHVHTNHFTMGQLGENPAFTMFDAFSQSQQKPASGVQYSAAGTVRNGNAQNRGWAYNTLCHSGSRQNEAAGGHFWSFTTPNHMPFRPNNPQKCSTQSSNTEMHSQCPEQHKRKMIRDLDLNLLDLNAANLENQNKTTDFEPFKRTPMDYSFVSKHRGIELNAKGMMGSLDPYSNETIPAMQLLSLMDPGMQSSTPFNVDSKRVLEKPFFPCDNHPNLTIDGKPNFPEKPLFSCPYHSKEFPGVFKAIESSRHPSSASYGKNHLSKKYCECSPAVEPFVSLFQNDGNLKGASSGSVKRSYPSTQNRGPRSKTVLEFNSGQEKQKGIVGASDSFIFPSQCHTRKESTKCIDLEARCMRGTNRPMKSNFKSDVCCVNRNPADFSLPEAGNEYMIRGEDLRVGKKIPSRGKSGILNVDGRKKSRVMKLTRMKEQQ